MIAATAIKHGLEPVTSNTTHFQRIPHLGYPLTLVNGSVQGHEYGREQDQVEKTRAAPGFIHRPPSLQSD